MSKFNTTTTGAMKTANRSGHEAYKMHVKENLTTKVLTTMFNEAKFYGDTSDELIQLAEQCAKQDAAYLTKLALYARREFNLRSVFHALTAVIARNAPEKERADCVRMAVKYGCLRADDLLEIMAAYKAMYGHPFPNALKRAAADKMNHFDTYSIGKYNRSGKAFTFCDVLRICHPRPEGECQQVLFDQIINDTVPTPYTWETELSARGNTAEVWNELLHSGKLGYMALLRNLKNIIVKGADVDAALAVIADPERVRKSKQLPFRFLSAYLRLRKEDLLTKKVATALSTAASVSVDNIEAIPGRSLIAIDTSGSMGWGVSARSDVTCAQIAALLGVMANRICEDAVVCEFNSKLKVSAYSGTEDILRTAADVRHPCSWTNMGLPLEYALNRPGTPFDRIIYLSDNECNNGRGTVQNLADQYRKERNPDFWVHAVDLQGYGTQQFIGSQFNLIAGWSERVLGFINLAEAGINSQVKAIEAYCIND